MAESHKPRVLVVDQDGLTRWSLTQYLGRWCQVCAAASGPEGAEFVATFRPEVVILSAELPEGGARRVLDAVRACGGQARVLVTAADVRQVPAECGEHSVIEKPFSLAELARRVGVGS